MGSWLYGVQNSNNSWLSNCILAAEDFSSETIDGGILCRFTAPVKEERFDGDFEYELTMKDSGHGMDLSKLTVVARYTADDLADKRMDLFRISFGKTIRDGDLVVAESCETEFESRTNGKLNYGSKDEFRLVSWKRCKIPEKLVFENIKLEDGERVLTRAPVRYEYHEGQIYKMVDDRSLQSLEGARMYKPSFWRTYKTFIQVGGLLAVIGVVAFFYRKARKT